MQVSEYFIRSYVDAALERVEISAEDRQTIIDYYKCVGFGLVLDWLNSGMNEDRAKAMRRMFLLKRMEFTLGYLQMIPSASSRMISSRRAGKS